MYHKSNNYESILIRIGSINFVSAHPLYWSWWLELYWLQFYRFQLKYFGISVHIAEPGFTNTNIISSSNVNYWQSKAWQECPEQIREEYGGQQYLEACKNFVNICNKCKIYLKIVCWIKGPFGLYLTDPGNYPIC